MGIDFKWNVTISSDIKTYKKISECFKIIDELSENNLQAKKSFLNFDFSDTIEIHANMLVVLEMIKKYHLSKLGNYKYKEISCQIRLLLEKIGYFSNKTELKQLEEKSITINFIRCFRQSEEVTNEKICSYILEILNYPEFKVVDESIKEEILINIAELCANIIQHTEAPYISICGQFFKEKKIFVLAISNLGETFFDKISSINSGNDIECIEWALQYSNSSKNEAGGLGLFLFLEFIKKIEGKVQIVSGKGFYEYSYETKNKEKIVKESLSYKIPGTVITFFLDLKKKIDYDN